MTMATAQRSGGGGASSARSQDVELALKDLHSPPARPQRRWLLRLSKHLCGRALRAAARQRTAARRLTSVRIWLQGRV